MLKNLKKANNAQIKNEKICIIVKMNILDLIHSNFKYGYTLLKQVI